MNKLSFLRKIGFAEGLSWLLLLGIAMPLKYIAKEPLPVKIVGWIHGILFISYLVQLLRVQIAYRWPFKFTIFGVVAAFLPFGTWFYDARLKKEEKALA
ncbi:MAG: DUF3817 domain-containing protein [Flavitalea sp.]